MKCDICERTASESRPLLCANCARSCIYNSRIDLVTSLLDREEASKRVRAAQTGDCTDVPATLTLDGAILDLRDYFKVKTVEQCKREDGAVSERVRSLHHKMERLQSNILEMRTLLAKKKELCARRRSDQESARYNLKARSAAEVETVQKATRQTRRKWDLDHASMIQGRISLCRSAAHLGGLRKHKIIEGQAVRERFEIARGLPIYHLKSLNRADPELLTASLTQVAYLVSQVSTYLALRPPAEIQLPQKDYAFATMFFPSSSYQNRDSKTPSSSDLNSPAASRHLSDRIATPRPLFVSRSLPKLYKDDQYAFSLFVEGVALLAWNIAWLCKTQGTGGFSSWTDICNIGRNLWQLLMADPRSVQKAAAAAVASDKDKQASHFILSHDNDTNDNATTTARVPAHFGLFSHGSANSFFGKVGTDMQLAWKLHTPTKAIDKIKAHLVQELQGAEWEILEDRDWQNAKEVLKIDDEPVLVGGRRWNLNKKDKDGTLSKARQGYT